MSFKWLLVVWESDGSFSVVNSRSIAGIIDKEVSEGDSIKVFQKRGVVGQAKVIRMSNDKKALEREVVKLKKAKVEPTPEASAPLLYEDPAADFSPSDSSWGPESQASSDSEGHVEDQVEKILLNTSRQYTNNKNKKVHRTPTLRPEPVMPINSNINRRAYQIENADQTRGIEEDKTVCVKAEEVAMVKREITNLRTMLGTLRLALSDIIRDKPTTNHLYDTKTASFTYDKSPKPTPINNQEDRNASTQTKDVEENTTSLTKIQHIRPLRYGMIRHNSSKVNAAIPAQTTAMTNDTNFTPPPPVFKKSYAKRIIVQTPNSTEQGKKEAAINGMIPIGSGKTFVVKRIYDQIDWNSYTMATRKLLMAVFPRKTLATHSLTGKASPAFADRPVKLCLDQKKVQDIISTVIEKCKVKECLVRGAITTKCADEYRMYRMKMAKDKKIRNGPYRILNGRDLDSPGNQHPQTDISQENQTI